MFTRALVFLGEIGGNDINYSLQEGKSIQEVYSYLPYMTEVISNAVRSKSKFEQRTVEVEAGGVHSESRAPSRHRRFLAHFLPSSETQHKTGTPLTIALSLSLVETLARKKSP
ncbi:unnamed protein product [Ilex paraguariensis]|uniref:Uncharacterized protein n=1 Tax=Ilex paraguariensis TaxID=185542 RepID=A0ABC8SAT0_9AQUA